MAWKTNWDVVIDGRSMASAFANYLISITVTDKAGSSSDSCQLVLDDTGGQIKLPQKGSKVAVFLNGVRVFYGIVDKPQSSGSRGAGMKLSVTAKGFDIRGKAKEPQRLHQDDGTVGSFLQKVAGKAGFNLKIDQALAGIQREYLAADGESLLHIGERLARELGGTFKLRGTDAALIKLGIDYGLPQISGIFAMDASGTGNVIDFNIEPIVNRSVFRDIEVSYFDRQAGEVLKHVSQAGEAGQRAEATNVIRNIVHDKKQAENIAEARKEESERKAGEGSVRLDLEPSAQAEGLFTLTGTRPGVDGTYRITSVTHTADRNGGSMTSLKLEQPHSGAGSDDRSESPDAPATPDAEGAVSAEPVPAPVPDPGGTLEIIGGVSGDGPE